MARASGRAFTRVFYAAAALLAAALLCLPVLVPLSFAALGFEPALRDGYAAESFQAYRATAPIRRAFLYGVAALAALLLALSAAALAPRRRRRLDMPWVVPVVAALGAASAAAVALAALLAPSGACC